MVINCYLALPSYHGIDITPLEDNLKEMCSLTRNHIPVENFFFDIEAFYSVKMKSGCSIMDGICSLPDQQFVNQVMYPELERFRTFNKAESKDTEYYCFWGYEFNPRKEYEFSIAKDYFDYRHESIYNSMSHDSFWSLKAYVFPSLVFADSVKGNIERLNGRSFSTIISGLQRLEQIAGDWKNKGKDILDGLRDLGRNYSGESQSTRDNADLMKKREFSFGERGVLRCENHLKLSDYLRIHFYLDYSTKSICIGYAGEHLPTSSVRH